MCTVENGLSLIKQIKVNCNSTRVYTNSKANETANLLTLLNYTKPYADSVATDQFFYPSENTGAAQALENNAAYNPAYAKRAALTAAKNNVAISIPLNLWSFFASFKETLAPNMKTDLTITLETDGNAILRANAAGAGRVMITKLRLWCPKIIFNGKGVQKYISDFLQPKKWNYLKEHIEAIQTRATNSFFPDFNWFEKTTTCVRLDCAFSKL